MTRMMMMMTRRVMMNYKWFPRHIEAALSVNCVNTSTLTRYCLHAPRIYEEKLHYDSVWECRWT